MMGNKNHDQEQKDEKARKEREEKEKREKEAAKKHDKAKKAEGGNAIPSQSSTTAQAVPGVPIVSGGQPIQTPEEAARGPGQDPTRPDANYESVNADPPGRVDQHLKGSGSLANRDGETPHAHR